ncbi:hypothetical protein EAF00_003108 [Botryotinia globosa]|nr:hypothetical protein EAF00_003108 [Botryotinia globosa]
MQSSQFLSPCTSNRLKEERFMFQTEYLKCYCWCNLNKAVKYKPKGASAYRYGTDQIIENGILSTQSFVDKAK